MSEHHAACLRSLANCCSPSQQIGADNNRSLCSSRKRRREQEQVAHACIFKRAHQAPSSLVATCSSALQAARLLSFIQISAGLKKQQQQVAHVDNSHFVTCGTNHSSRSPNRADYVRPLPCQRGTQAAQLLFIGGVLLGRHRRRKDLPGEGMATKAAARQFAAARNELRGASQWNKSGGRHFFLPGTCAVNLRLAVATH